MIAAKKITISLITLCAILSQDLMAQSEMQIGTRPLGMGGAYTAISDDANAIFWNPAGLGMINQSQATISQWSLGEISEISVNSGAGIYTTGVGNFSFGWTRLAAELHEGRNQNSSMMTDNLFQLGYGVAFNEYLSAGLNLNRRMIQSLRGDAAGLGFDLGILYKPFTEQDFKIGATVKNAASSLDEETVRPDYRLGLAYSIGFQDDIHEITISTDGFTRYDVNNIEGHSYNFAGGLEYGLNIQEFTLSLRGGASLIAENQALHQSAFGASLGWQWFSADYVYTMSMQNTIGDSQRFGMSFHF